MKEHTDTAKDLFDIYAEYNRLLRTWFIAFGVGLPAAIFANDKSRDCFISDPSRELIIYAILMGIALQIIITAINKYLNWISYYHKANNTEPESNCFYKIFYDRIWIDAVVDIVTFTLYSFVLVRISIILKFI